MTSPAAPPQLFSEREIVRPDGNRQHVQSQMFAIRTGRGRMMGAITRGVRGHSFVAKDEKTKLALAQEHQLSELRRRVSSRLRPTSFARL